MASEAERRAYMYDWLQSPESQFDDKDDLDLFQQDGSDSDEMYQHGQSDGDSSTTDEEGQGDAGFGHEMSQLMQAVHRRKHLVPQEDLSEDDADTDSVDSLPSWYKNGPFMYHGRIALLSLPQTFFALIVGGDWLLMVLGVGLMLVYILHNVFNTHSWSFTAYILTCISVCLVLVLSLSPLLWRSLLSLLLVVGFVWLAALQCSWGILASSSYTDRNAELTKSIETQLFSVYPILCVSLTTWMVATATSVMLTPYIFLLLGFPVLHVFLAPSRSSYWKDGEADQFYYILSPTAVVLVTVTYMAACPTAHLFVLCVHGEQNLISMQTLVELVFLTTASVFLGSHLHVRPHLEQLGLLTGLWVRRVRWGCVFGWVCITPLLLHHLGLRSTLLPWWALGFMALHALYALTMVAKERRLQYLLGGLLLLLLGAYLAQLPWTLNEMIQLFIPLQRLQYLLGGLLLLLLGAYLAQLPWTLNHTLPGGMWLPQFYLYVGLSAVLAVICVGLSAHTTGDKLGALLLLHSLLHVSLSSLLPDGSTSYVAVSIVTSLSFIYLFLRLHHVGKIPHQHAAIACSIHFTSILTILISSHMTTAHGGHMIVSSLLSVYRVVSLFIWCLVLNLCFLFDNLKQLGSTPAEQIKPYMLRVMGVCAATVVAGPHLLPPLWHWITGVPLQLAHYLALSLLSAALESLRLALHLQKAPSWTRHAPMLLGATVGLILLLQPQFVLNWEEVCKLSIAGSFGAAIVLAVLVQRPQSLPTLALMALAAGYPLASQAPSLIFGAETVSMETCILYGLSVPSVIITTIVALEQRGSREYRLSLCFSVMFILTAALLISDSFGPAPSSAPVVTVGNLGASLVQLALAGIYKVSTRLTTEALLAKDNQVTQQSHLPTASNIATLGSFGLLVALWPLRVWQLWVTLCSAVLFLFSTDALLLPSLTRTNQPTAPIIVVTAMLYASAAWECRLWYVRVGLVWMQGCLELLILAVALPLLINIWTISWNYTELLNRQLVTLASPVFAVLVILGTTYVAMALGAVGLSLSMWIIWGKLGIKMDF